MKTITYYLLVILSILYQSSFSQTATAKDGNGSDYWSETDSWEDGIIPSCGSYTKIIIPNGVYLILKTNVTLNCNIEIIIESGGVLRLKSIANTPTVLDLGTGSSITVETGGEIETDNQNSAHHAVNEIVISGNSEWTGRDGNIPGYKRYPSILPIELLEFSAKSINGNVELYWSTSSENNNNFFTIEKSNNGINFKQVAIIDGAGNSSEINNYSTIDYEAKEGTWYYRLKQTDYDGGYEYFDLIGVTVKLNNNDDCIVTVNPNPCLGHCTVIMTKCSENISGVTKIYVMDISGNMVLKEMPQISSDGSFQYNIDVTNKFTPGVYLIKVGENKNNKTKKVIIK